MEQVEISICNSCSIRSGIVIFDSPGSKKTLADLFDGRSHLIVYHCMVGPEWNEGCPGCSLVMDHADDGLVHLATHEGVSHPTFSSFTQVCFSEAGLQHACCSAKLHGRHIVPIRLTNTPL